METEYRNMRVQFKKILSIFRLKLLVYDLLSGLVWLFFSFLSLLYVYGFLSSFFSFPVIVKTVCFYGFVSILVIEGLWFIVKPLGNFFLSYRFSNDILLQRLLKYSSLKADVLTSLYMFAFHRKEIAGDEKLKEAAFIQKFLILNKENTFHLFPDRYYFRKLLYLSVLLIFSFSTMSQWKKYFIGLNNYQVASTLGTEIHFSLLNDSLEVEYGKPFQLKLKVNTDFSTVNNVFICYGGGEFLMTAADSIFTYRFDVVNNDVTFFFKTDRVVSDYFTLKVLPVPVITSYKVTSFPPAYTGLSVESQENTVDFRVIYGSSLKFELNFAHVDSLYLQTGKDIRSSSSASSSKVDFTKNIRSSGEYIIYGSNAFFRQKELIHFHVDCLPDLYPSIQITEVQDSLRPSLYYYYGIITDDFGFSGLTFNYALGHNPPSVVNIPFSKMSKAQEFFFSYDFAEFSGSEEGDISYFFEVFDNDEISGPKSTRSIRENYRIPDLNSIFDSNIDMDVSVNASLKDAEKLVGEIVSGIEELQKKILDNAVDNWEKQQLSKEIVSKKKRLEQLLQTVKENNLKKANLNRSFTRQDSTLIEKQKQIQDLLDKVMDEDMKNLLQEFSKLTHEFSKDKFKNLDEKMKLSFDQVSDQLDRNIELLKRFQIEERHHLITRQFEKLKSDQEKLSENSENKSLSVDSLSFQSEKMRKNLENIEKNYEQLLKDNQDLIEPFTLERYQSEFNNLMQHLDKQEKNISEKKRDKHLTEQIKKDIDGLSKRMKEQQEQNFVNKSLPQNDIELIIQNILIISLSQEELIRQFQRVETQSLKYNELGRLQDLKRQEYRIVKDSLSILAKSDLMLASLLSHKFYELEIKFGLLPGYVQDNKRSELYREQQYIINYLNDIALSLTEALRKDRSNSGDKRQSDKQKNSGRSGKDGKSSGGAETGYNRMKQFQKGLKQQLEDLISQMKKGEKGKPLQQGISNMIRQNELFKKSLEDYISETGSMSNAEKQLLNEIHRLLDENVRDLANYSISNHLINRNNQIFTKLLMSEKASKEREEFEEKRKSESAMEKHFTKPDQLWEYKKKSGFIRTDIRKRDLKLNDYFETMYNNYYIKLGNE